MEDILSNEKSKKKAIKYVINLGKNFRNIKNSKSPKVRSNYKNRGKQKKSNYLT